MEKCLVILRTVSYNTIKNMKNFYKNQQLCVSDAIYDVNKLIKLKLIIVDGTLCLKTHFKDTHVDNNVIYLQKMNKHVPEMMLANV